MTTFEYLEQLYPGAALLTVKQTGIAIQRAEQTIRHYLSHGTFEIPLAPASRPRRPLFRKIDVAAFVDGTLPIPSPAASERTPRRRGRRTNAEKFAAERLASGGEQ